MTTPPGKSAALAEEGGRWEGAYVPFSRVLPGAAAADTTAPAPEDGVVRLAASPRADAEVVYEGMVERYGREGEKEREGGGGQRGKERKHGVRRSCDSVSCVQGAAGREIRFFR